MDDTSRRRMRQQLAQLGNGAHALATQILGNTDDAADAVHDAFAKALAHPEKYDSSKGAMRPWFMRVVRNRCLDMLRSRRAPGLAADELPHPGNGPEQATAEAQQSAALKTALRSLPDAKGEIIILRDYLDLSYAEIADALDISKGTVMSRLHRARLALKEALDSHGE